MNYLNEIFSYYDQLIAHLSTSQQALLSLILLIFFVWQIFMIIKSGHWIFIALLVVLLPGTWPATKQFGSFVLIFLKFLLTRSQLLFN